MGKGEKPILSVRIDSWLMDEIERVCEETGCGRGEVVERALSLGLRTDRKFEEWLKGSVSGPVLGLLTHPKVIGALLSLAGDEIDPVLEKRREVAEEKRKQRKQPRGAVKMR